MDTNRKHRRELRRRLVLYFYENFENFAAGPKIDASTLAHQMKLVQPDDIEDDELRAELLKAIEKGYDPRTNDGSAWSEKTFLRDIELLSEDRDFWNHQTTDESDNDA